VWSSFFPTFFAPLFTYLWPTSTVLKRPKHTQLLSMFDLLFEVFSENLSYFLSFKTSTLQHLSCLKASQHSSTTSQPPPLQPSAKKRRLSSSVLPVSLPHPPQQFTPDDNVTDISHPHHVNFNHFQNLLDLMFVFLPVLKLYKLQLRTSSLPVTLLNLQRLLYIFMSCPSPSYISALLLQLHQFYSWDKEFPAFLQFFATNASLLNEDLGEISLSKIRQHAPFILQNPTLLSKHYMMSGVYSAMNIKLPKEEGRKRPNPWRIKLKQGIVDFLMKEYIPKVSLPTPYLYFFPLPSNVFKLNLKSSQPTNSAPVQIILKTKKQTQQLLEKYVNNCYRLLNPNKKAPQKRKKQQKQHSPEEESDDSEEDGDELWNGELENMEEEGEVDHELIEILAHRNKQITIDGTIHKELQYLVEFHPPDNDGKSQKWMPESELLDCEKLLEKYWQEDQ